MIMTLQTWKDEFYPVEANKVSEDDAVAHSLQKWIGLRQENLDKHSVYLGFAYSPLVSILDDNDNNPLEITDKSCALCEYYLESDYSCAKCPLNIHLGKVCDKGFGSPYIVFGSTGNPEPMIKALSAILNEEA